LHTVSHDRLTRLVQADWSGQTLLESAFHTLFAGKRGYLILDDAVIPKPFATAIEGVAWVSSSHEQRAVSGLSLVLLVWTDGRSRVPGGLRLWRQGGPSKYILALELLSSARNRLRCPPDAVLFDAWSPSNALWKRLRDDGWSVICRLKKHRRFNGQPRRAYRRHPYGTETGRLRGGLKVLVVRDGATYSATNHLSRPAAEVRRLYRVRTQIEEVSRACKGQRGLGGCQARPERAPLQHSTCCFVAFCVLERECQDQGLSIYQLKRHLSFQGRSIALPALERLRSAA
jgi:hypothetical protein